MKGTHLSLGVRLYIIVLSSLLPLTMLIGYLLYVQNRTIHAFDHVAGSVNYASMYVKEFKERMDYSIYYALTWGKGIDELGENMYSVGGVEMVDPYAYLDEMREACAEMSNLATVSSNRYLPKRIINTLNSLERVIEEIDKNSREKGHYDENKALLEDVRGMTELIQDNIQNYINDENASFTRMKEEMMGRTKQTFRICMIIVAAVVIFTLCLSRMTLQRLIQPVRRLCDASKQVAKGDFTVRSQAKSKDEIAVLVENFNNMTAEIGSLVDRIKEEEKNIRLMETKLLQAQINPHFLYNTLDTIIWLAEAGQREQVVRMITYLSTFFRTTLSKGKDTITLEEERRHVESYLQIQQFRYQDIMTYDLSIDEKIRDHTVPKLTLQPLVENALYHGIKSKRGGGRITVMGRKYGAVIHLCVEDTGKGIAPEELDGLRAYIEGADNGAERGFGLANVHERIRRYYGEQYGISIESRVGEGTRVTVVIPACP